MNVFRLLTVLLLATPYASMAQAFEMYLGDTINRRDAQNKRQGKWRMLENGKLESEGNYIDDRREGMWISYYPDGKRKAEITYTNGRKKGPAKTYYPSGKPAEEGIWDSNKWTGTYKAYHENGSMAYDWNYNELGQKVGQQKYYFPNGKLMLDGNWQAGKITGTLKEYYSDGTKKSERSFVDGKVDHSQTKFFEPAKMEVAQQDEQTLKELPQGNISTGKEVQDQVSSYFTGEGYHKLYKDSLLSREGEFRGGKLYTGKHLFYSENGKLIKTVMYQDGKVTQVITP